MSKYVVLTDHAIDGVGKGGTVEPGPAIYVEALLASGLVGPVSDDDEPAEDDEEPAEDDEPAVQEPEPAAEGDELELDPVADPEEGS